MRLQLKNALIERLNEHLPEVLGTAWQTSDIHLFVEEAKLLQTSMNQPANDAWETIADFQGAAITELMTEAVDDLNTDALWASLHTKPLLVELPADAAIGDVARYVTATFEGERDYLDDMKCVTTLRFSLSGSLCQCVETCPAPSEVHLGKAPNIGADHVDDYTQIAGDEE